jgi:drug/metabolite transporter (DMT)-like permease
MSAVSETVPVKRSADATTLGAVIVTVIAWASAFPAIRAGLKAFGPIELGALRFAIAAVPAALFLVVSRPRLPSPAEAWRFAVGGLFFVALYTGLLNMGEQSVAAGAASFIINVNPIITAVMAMTILGEPFGKLAWAGTAISFAGIGLIALGEGGGLRLDTGALLILGAALCNSITTITQKPLFTRHKPLTVSAWNMVLGALFLSPFLPSGLAQAQSASSQSLFAALYLGIVPSLIAYATWTIVLSRFPAARAANFMYCVPPVATLMGYLWLGETPALIGALGGALALGGVVIVNLRR